MMRTRRAGFLAVVALVVAACSSPQEHYADRIEVDEAELVIFFHADAFVADIEASIEVLGELAGGIERTRVQWRDPEEVALDAELLARTYGDDIAATSEVGEALVIDLIDDVGADWLLVNGDVMARQRGVLDVSIEGSSKRLDPLCYWGGDTDLVVWLTDASSSTAETFLGTHLVGLGVEAISPDIAFEQMLVLLEFQPRLADGLTATAMPTGLFVDVGTDPSTADLAELRRDLGAVEAVSSVIVRPPATVSTVCP